MFTNKLQQGNAFCPDPFSQYFFPIHSQIFNHHYHLNIANRFICATFDSTLVLIDVDVKAATILKQNATAYHRTCKQPKIAGYIFSTYFTSLTLPLIKLDSLLHKKIRQLFS